MDARLSCFIYRCRAIWVGNSAITQTLDPQAARLSHETDYIWPSINSYAGGGNLLITFSFCARRKRIICVAMAPFSFRGRLGAASLSKKRFKSKAKHGRKGVKDMQESFKRLKSEMEEISEEQKIIREGQRQVKQKFEAIESECEVLKRETRLIIQQSARTQVKLALMFRILKARESGDFNAAASLTEMLREIVAREKEGN
ncbi:uncharacterized protein LOC111308531 [Durio zibethinus]|uniref:Uncharacterized protein LOC111308531 n=1 Tax=Durio zibethinus TaxID=66656 RepID=A0A6P6ACR7_DURZI|nr:uncharacterized protein LOC111308531 [Durio zibethinus]